jgi:uncharacterized protein
VLKVVIDATVWISSILSPGISRKIRDSVERHDFAFYYSVEMMVDLQDALSKPKLMARIPVQAANELLTLIEEEAVLVALSPYSAICRDPDDDVYLACAAQNNCNFIVSGDMDLLSLKEYASVKIVTPAQFLEILNS